MSLTALTSAQDAIRALNERLRDATRVMISTIPASDGITLARKR